jgi:hypothetical protein
MHEAATRQMNQLYARVLITILAVDGGVSLVEFVEIDCEEEGKLSGRIFVGLGNETRRGESLGRGGDCKERLRCFLGEERLEIEEKKEEEMVKDGWSEGGEEDENGPSMLVFLSFTQVGP